MSNYRTGWSFIGEAFAMARENRKLLSASVYQVLCAIVYFAAWAGVLLAVQPQWSNGTWSVVGAVATFGSFVIFYFFCGITVKMVDVHLKGGEPSLAEGARDAGKNIVAIMFLALVSTIIDSLRTAAGNDKSILGKILASIVETVWATLAFLMLPAIIIEDISLGEALTRVRALHRNNLLQIGVGEIGVRAVTGLIGLLWCFLIVLVMAIDFSVLSGTAAAVVGIFVGGSMLALFVAFATYLRMAYYTCLYLWAVDVEKHGPSAPAPLPLATALKRR